MLFKRRPPSLYFQVNKFEVEKMALQKDVASITSKLVDAKVQICDLEEESVSRNVLHST